MTDRLTLHLHNRQQAWVAAYLDHPAVKGRRENLRRDLNEQIRLKNSGGKGEWRSE